MINYYLKIVYNFFKPIYLLILFYVGWIFLHYFSAQLYISYCTPQTIWGFIASPFLSVAPHCNGLRWIIYESGTILYCMWTSLAAWIVTNLLTYKYD